MSVSELNETIYEQFLGYVRNYLDRTVCRFKNCDYTYSTLTYDDKKYMKIVATICDECDVKRNVITILDISSICWSKLNKTYWENYLKREAILFVGNICPKRHVIRKPYICKYEVPLWVPKDLKTVTIITKSAFEEKERPNIEYIIKEKCGDCNRCCNRKIKPPQHDFVIEHEELEPKCGTCLGVPLIEKFVTNKNIVDYNDHKFPVK